MKKLKLKQELANRLGLESQNLEGWQFFKRGSTSDDVKKGKGPMQMQVGLCSRDIATSIYSK